MKAALCVLVLGSMASVATAQQLGIQLGIDAGVYLPSDTTIRNVFGDQLYTVGITPVGFGRPGSGRITPSFNVIGADKNGSNFLLIPVTLGYEYHFGDDTGSTVPYARLEAGASYYKYNVNVPGGNVSGSKFGYVGAAELGVEFNKAIRLSAKYYGFQKLDGLNFNGLEISITFGLFRL